MTVEATSLITAVVETLSIIPATLLDRKLESTERWLNGLLERAPVFYGKDWAKPKETHEEKEQKTKKKGGKIPDEEQGRRTPREPEPPKTPEVTPHEPAQSKGKEVEPTARSESSHQAGDFVYSREYVTKKYPELIERYDSSILLFLLSRV